MKILVVNAGSSSLKYQLFDMDTQDVLAKGLCERIGIDGRYKYSAAGKEEIKGDYPMPTHADAIKLLTKNLTDPEIGVISSMDEIDAVGHRVLTAGDIYSDSVFIDDTVKKVIRDCIPIGPLHNPANLTGIEACAEVIKDVPQVAVFDTGFHMTMPPKAFLYAIPYRYYEEYRLRKYGFHGTSHRYVSGKAIEMLGNPHAKIVTCHLGNGSSCAAVKDGKVIDTSMGLTPLEGLPMGTRSGNLDPAVLGFIGDHEGKSASEIVTMLNKESGVLGVSGVSSDFRDLEAAANEGNERARIALDMFIYSVRKYIGAYAAAMGGIDAVVFTAGIGENNGRIRAAIMEGLEFLGFELDQEKNLKTREQADVSAPGAKAKTLVIPTNEELVIAMDTMNIVLQRA
ncbi:MAG: acetate kinase [Clostridia bacterium]|nr:acetate kinase [Clostridia bacterium]